MMKIFGEIVNGMFDRILTEAAIQRCSYKVVFLKYAGNLRENAHTKVSCQ